MGHAESRAAPVAAPARNEELEREIDSRLPSELKFFGFKNLGNTCYVGAVVQALYADLRFRRCMLAHCAATEAATTGGGRGRRRSAATLLDALSSLFVDIATQPRRTGALAPTRLVELVWQEEERFPEGQQCDAHELLVHLLDSLAETLNAARGATGAGVGGNARGSVAPLVSVSVESPSVSSGKSITLSRSEFLLAREPHLWVDRIFQGATTTEVRCTRCGTSTTRDEVFRDLSLDVSDNTSVYHSLKRFTAPEVLSEFQCPKCPARVKATRSVRFLALPRTLVLHLKRFRGKVGSEPVKLPHRVVFPRELCLAVLSAESCMRRDRRYELFAVVAHVGRGLSSGHYVCLARHGPQWFLYDDDVVVAVTEDDLQSCFGSPHRDFSNEAYLLFYSAA